MCILKLKITIKWSIKDEQTIELFCLSMWRMMMWRGGGGMFVVVLLLWNFYKIICRWFKRVDRSLFRNTFKFNLPVNSTNSSRYVVLTQLNEFNRNGEICIKKQAKVKPFLWNRFDQVVKKKFGLLRSVLGFTDILLNK